MDEILKIDEERLWDSHMEMARIGETEKGGVCRLALTEEDGAARDLFVEWCRAAGLAIEVDQIGNIFARRAGRNEGAPPIATGSHLDTQPTGGKFDGAYGVLAALEVVRTLNARGVETDLPIEVVVWTNEEGCRFQPSSLGAEVCAGGLSLEEGLNRTDPDGKRLGDELQQIGYAGDFPVGIHGIGAYIEAHIEQGPILEESGNVIGVVEGGMGVSAYEVTLSGKEAHTGTTPVLRRKDALLGAARIITEVNILARKYEPDGRATVAQLGITPNVRSVVVGRVVLTSDCRHKDEDRFKQMIAELHDIFHRAAADHGLQLDVRPYWNIASSRFDRRCVAEVQKAAERLGYPHMTLYSGAAHDAIPISRVVPTSMIFVPSEGGLSHNEAEYTSPEHLAAGCNVLLHSILGLAGQSHVSGERGA